jgi:hypothetical protein
MNQLQVSVTSSDGRGIPICIQDKESMVIRSFHDIEIVEGQRMLNLDPEPVSVLGADEVIEPEDHTMVSLIIHWAEVEGCTIHEEEVKPHDHLIVTNLNHVVIMRNNCISEASEVGRGVER